MKFPWPIGLLAIVLALAPACGSDDPQPPTRVSRAVIELDISGMTGESDADDVRRTLESVDGVEKAKVNFAAGKAKVLMKAAVRMDDLPDAVEDLRDALSAPLKVTGFSWEFNKSTKLDW